MKISYAITVCNEFIELVKLIDHLTKHIDLNKHEIVILCDETKTTDEIIEYAKNLNYKFVLDKFNNNFSEWKNKLKTICSGDYIFQIDADEIPNDFLLNNIDKILYNNSSIELFWIPRENYVSGLTSEHTNKWGWTIDNLNRINFPDYQARLFKNLPHIYWQNKVHEIIVGATAQGTLPAEPRFCLIHAKDIVKQEQQNNYYDQL